MKTAFLFVALSSLACPLFAAPLETPHCRLTVELRDGSKIVGQPTGETLKFQSALLGGLKLKFKEIRSVNCAGTDPAMLTLANGDVVSVHFEGFAIKTSFGKVELEQAAIRKFSVMTTGSGGERTPGLVALWSGEGDGRDSVGNNDAELKNMNFAEGKVGQAFSLDGSSSWMKIPANSTLDVGRGNGFTVMAWIKPNNVQGFHPIMEWEVTAHQGAVELWLGRHPNSFGVLAGFICSRNGQANVIPPSPTGAIVSGRFQHVALTYDKESGTAKLYINGYVVGESNIGTITPNTASDLFISRRPNDRPGDWTYDKFFNGLMDEIAVYNRALNGEEIKSICLEDNHSEPLPPPAATKRLIPSRSYPTGEEE
jgi:hypothetical protein